MALEHSLVKEKGKKEDEKKNCSHFYVIFSTLRTFSTWPQAKKLPSLEQNQVRGTDYGQLWHSDLQWDSAEKLQLSNGDETTPHYNEIVLAIKISLQCPLFLINVRKIRTITAGKDNTAGRALWQKNDISSFLAFHGKLHFGKKKMCIYSHAFSQSTQAEYH